MLASQLLESYEKRFEIFLRETTMKNYQFLLRHMHFIEEAIVKKYKNTESIPPIFKKILDLLFPPLPFKNQSAKTGVIVTALPKSGSTFCLHL